AHIGQVHHDVFFSWTVVAQVVQPRRGAGAAPGGIDHQIGAERDVVAGATVDDPSACDAMVVGCRGQLHDVVCVEQRDVGDAAKSGADVFFQERPGREVGGKGRGGAGTRHQVPADVVM